MRMRRWGTISASTILILIMLLAGTAWAPRTCGGCGTGIGMMGEQVLILEAAGAAGVSSTVPLAHLVLLSPAGVVAVELSCVAKATSTAPVELGGVMYASGLGSDGNGYLLQIQDTGPGNGMDEVGIIIVGAAPDPTAEQCGAAEVRVAPITAGDFIVADAETPA
jgi:hypothetical protein